MEVRGLSRISPTWNHRHDKVGLAFDVMVNGVDCDLFSPLVPKGFSRVGVHVEAWEIRARDVEPDAMSGCKQIARGIEGNRDSIHLIGLGEGGGAIVFAISQPLNRIGEIEMIAVRPIR